LDYVGTSLSGSCLEGDVTGGASRTINFVTCNDGNPCTEDICTPAIGCSHTPIVCNDNNACTTDTCDTTTGCVFTPNPPCNDNNACTTDTCDPATGCVFTPNPPCNDNNACTTDTCDPLTGCVYTPNAPCNDNNACTTDTCDPATGCVYTPNAPCNDNNACTTDTCDPLTGCVYTPNAPCDDNNNCTTDTCDPATGCVYTPNANCQNGCTPGFWKNCTGQWPASVPLNTSLSSVFNVSPGCVAGNGNKQVNLSSASLKDALSFQGGSSLNGAAQILMRAAAAAYLNASKDIGYPLSTADIISQVNAALASCDRTTILTLASTLDGYNNLGCRDANGDGLRCLR
jgi:hypothetical protein